MTEQKLKPVRPQLEALVTQDRDLLKALVKAETPPQVLEIYNCNRIREFDENLSQNWLRARLLCRVLARPSLYGYVLSRGSLLAFAYSGCSPHFEIGSSLRPNWPRA